MLTRIALITTGAAVLSTMSTPTFADDSRSLTIYNENFAVVRENVPLNLTAGLNHVTFNDLTYSCRARLTRHPSRPGRQADA